MAAPLQATNVDNMYKATSGLYRVEIDSAPEKDTDVTEPPAVDGWVEIKGLSKFNPSFEQNNEDDSTIATGAFKSEFPVGQAFSVEVEGFTIGEPSGGSFTRDPGLNILIAASETYSNEGIVRIRYQRTDDIEEAKVFFATAGVKRSGEKPPALDKFSGTLSGRGAPQDIAKWDDAGAITNP